LIFTSRLTLCKSSRRSMSGIWSNDLISSHFYQGIASAMKEAGQPFDVSDRPV
jgi:hypothetical protein